MDSTIGIPASNVVDKVRVKRAIMLFFKTIPMTGNLNFNLSKFFRTSGLSFSENFQLRMRATMNITATHQKCRTKSESLTIIRVKNGNLAPNEENIAWN